MTWLASMALLAFVDDPERIRAIWEAMARELEPKRPAIKKPVEPDYWAQKAMAERDGRPLVVGVGVAPPLGEWLTCQVTAPWQTWRQATVVVSIPRGGELIWLYDLPADAKATDVMRVLMASGWYDARGRSLLGVPSSRGSPGEVKQWAVPSSSK